MKDTIGDSAATTGRGTPANIRLKIVGSVWAVSNIILLILLSCHLIGEAAYVAMFCFLLAFGLVAYEFPRLREVSLGADRIQAVLKDVKEVQEDVFAKAATVKEIAGHVADIARVAATDGLQLMHIWGFDLLYGREETRMRMRDAIVACLKSANEAKRKLIQP
ncbi:MAG: hypothetical protein E4H02_06470 [Lentisphaerales bacterium]|jgi:hypothetical protein|nr:MAG: hypothetical protein E4H02_06470 [Lentisphaerales bacterium]